MSSMHPEADRRLLDNVRPTDWDNPTPRDRYDLAVVGAGTGGLVSAAIGASLGARVALVERDRLGGDCLNHGCVPSKAVLRAARSWAEARAASERFGGPPVSGGGDFSRVMDRMRRLRADLSDVDGAHRFRSMGVDIFFGESHFVGDDALEVAGARLRFRRAILATGARAVVPPIDGLAGVDWLTNESVFDLRERPARLTILGAGPIGCELAQAFARFGSRVTLLDMADRVLPREEPEASRVLVSALEADGVRFVAGARVVRVQPVGPGNRVIFEREGSQGGAVEGEVEADALLLAVGRTPNVNLGLEAAGIAYTSKGVRVDARLRTTNRRVYAVGDVASAMQFTHVADAQARIAVRNALFFGRGRTTDLVVPAATFTSPEVARVGATAEELRAAGTEAETVTVELSGVDRARLDGDEAGFVKVHVARGKDRILGATIVAPHAGEIIAQVGQAMAFGHGLDAVGRVIFPYPTVAEGLRKAADELRRGKLTPRVRRAFGLYFRLSRLLP